MVTDNRWHVGYIQNGAVSSGVKVWFEKNLLVG